MAILHDISIDEYHRSKNVSSSKLRDFAAYGSCYYAARYVTGNLPDEHVTDARVYGQAFEDLLCTPKQFGLKYAVKPEGMSFAKTDGKTWKANAEAAGLTILAADDYAAMQAMIEGIYENETATQLVQAARQQVTITCDHDGIPGLQARPDFFGDQGCAITGFLPYTLDLKTTATLQKLSSGRDIAEYGYHQQAAIGRECLRRNGVDDTLHYLLASEKRAPYRALVIRLDESWLNAGWHWSAEQIALLASHYASGNWPRNDEELITLSAPMWLPGADNTFTEEHDEQAA
jgi:PDDEXK-like domain of unknown function (DUF3799)